MTQAISTHAELVAERYALLREIEELMKDVARLNFFVGNTVESLNGKNIKSFQIDIAEYLQNDCPMDEFGNHPPITVEIFKNAIDYAMKNETP